ncbi:MAG: nucleotidyl transferase AbiEii/AbiGii toxin family protein [Proteobacteria bacterium]|nr:nucleotidyl transferase AbiEii/AbiGii toxin family protein [Pseudomonadota bacterium]
MFEKVLPKNSIRVIEKISPGINAFYLAGGTGLALQLGHRKSADFDFFSADPFNPDALLEHIRPAKTLLVQEGTIHCELDQVKLSFLFYRQPLVYPSISWKGIKLSDWKDITAEKFKSVSQRGSKKDFYDLYAILQMKLSIEEACGIFKTRFASSGLNLYHVLKSLTFFEETEGEPDPMLIINKSEWNWKKIKNYFVKNIKEFEKYLVLSVNSQK